ncbi:zinc-dependent metalloprotease [soil metagenome]|jgi:coenzyme F420 biosynthesis associated uncharacterized protein
MIAWEASRKIAVTLARRTEPSAHVQGAGGFDYPGAVSQSLAPLTEFTGIEIPEDAGRRLRVADRSEWIDFNIKGFGRLIEPLVNRAAAGTNGVTWAFGAATLTTQIGLLLGFLSSRVLGQYDTGPVPLDGSSQTSREPGEVFFLDGNIVSAADRIGVPVDGLRLWIVLHEMTHALQFEGFPWLREHLGTMLEEVVTPLADRLGPREAIMRVVETARSGGRDVQRLLLNGDQREAFDRMQATMSVIEGYSDYVMHNVGRAIVPGYDHLSRRMAQSRMQRSPLETLIFRISGLDAKIEQYRLGEEFASAVVSRQGMEGLNRVWESPETLPSLAEVRDPGLWMYRMERV